MNTSAALLAGLDALDGAGLKERFAAARRAALTAGANAEVEGAMAALQAATRAGIIAMAGAVEASLAAQPLPAPPPFKRPGPADFAAAAKAGAARNAARPPSPMRRVPAPVRVPEEYVAGVAAPVPAPRPNRLANLRKPVVEDAPRDMEASTPAPAAPAPQPAVAPGVKYDPEKLAAHKRRYGKASSPYVMPNGTVNYDAPMWDRGDDDVPF